MKKSEMVEKLKSKRNMIDTKILFAVSKKKLKKVSNLKDYLKE